MWCKEIPSTEQTRAHAKNARKLDPPNSHFLSHSPGDFDIHWFENIEVEALMLCLLYLHQLSKCNLMRKTLP